MLTIKNITNVSKVTTICMKTVAGFLHDRLNVRQSMYFYILCNFETRTLNTT